MQWRRALPWPRGRGVIRRLWLRRISSGRYLDLWGTTLGTGMGSMDTGRGGGTGDIRVSIGPLRHNSTISRW